MVESASGLTDNRLEGLALGDEFAEGRRAGDRRAAKDNGREAGHAGFERGLNLLRAADQGFRPAVLGHIGDLGRGQHHVDRVDHGAGLQRAVVADDPLPGIRRIERHPVAGPDAEPDEARRERARQIVEVAKAERASLDHERGPVAEGARRVREHLSKGIEHHQPLSFRRDAKRGALILPWVDLRTASGRCRADGAARFYAPLICRGLNSSRSLTRRAPYSPKRESGVHPCEIRPGTRSQVPASLLRLTRIFPLRAPASLPRRRRCSPASA